MNGQRRCRAREEHAHQVKQSGFCLTCCACPESKGRVTSHFGNGFSLIELVVVLVLMGMLAGTAAVSVRGVVVRQDLSRAAEIVEQFDTALRRTARHQRRSLVGVVNRAGQSLSIETARDNRRTFKLPRQVTIDSIRFATSNRNQLQDRIVVNGDGVGFSYAIRLAYGETDRWVFFAGGSGQVVHGLSGDSINSLLAVR